MVEDVTSAIEESIKDEIGESNSRVSASHVSHNAAAREGASSKTKPRAGEAEDQLTVFLREVEKAIDSERSEREEKLARDLKKRRISPRSYDRGIKDIEKWVVREKRELMQRRRKMEDNNSEIQKYVQRFKKDQKSVPMLNKLSSPRNDRSYMDDSDNSEKMQTAMR